MGKKIPLNRQNLLALDHINKIAKSIDLNNDCLAGTRFIHGDYAFVFKDKSLLILDGKDFKKEKARISVGANEPARTILGYQIEGTRSGSLLKSEYGGKAVKEYDQAGKLTKTINLNINTGSSSIYGAPLTMNTNGNFLIGTRLRQTAAELNLEG